MSQSPAPSKRHRHRLVFGLALTLAGICSLPATAEWLATRDGHRIETDGPWKVKGRIVVYTDAKGTLSSIRLDEIDPEASEAVSEEPPETPAKPPVADANGSRR
jgi:hypothetical protein